ncbi:hypothetical protein ACOMHN_050502 [Nucella lapillus]
MYILSQLPAMNISEVVIARRCQMVLMIISKKTDSATWLHPLGVETLPSLQPEGVVTSTVTLSDVMWQTCAGVSSADQHSQKTSTYSLVG